jgi:hypothetical protein
VFEEDISTIVSRHAFYYFEKLQLTDCVSALRTTAVKLVMFVTSGTEVLKFSVVSGCFNFIDDKKVEVKFTL